MCVPAKEQEEEVKEEEEEEKDDVFQSSWATTNQPMWRRLQTIMIAIGQIVSFVFV